MSYATSEKTVKCRKRHRCRVCDESFQIGETAIRRSGFDDCSGPWTIHMHPECEVLTREWAYEDWEIISPGEYKRPPRTVKLRNPVPSKI